MAIERHLRQFDRLGEDLKVIEQDLARSALADDSVKRLMTIPGIDMVVALAMTAAIGEIGRFERPEKLVSYLGLNPSVRQSVPDRLTTAGLRNRVAATLAACWWRRLGQRCGHPVRCGPSFCACAAGAVSMSPLSQLRANLPF